MKKKHLIILICFLTLVIIIRLLATTGFLYLLVASTKPEINADINKYNDYIGSTAKEEYKDKWGMDESIFPSTIEEAFLVEDYKMVYYNPWDAQYLSYLVINYNEEDYNKELDRLRKYHSTKYQGYYGAEGFDKYILLAMYADYYNGFVYAITDGNRKIIYVELIFCNYQYDMDYEEYINNEYLPTSFDAKSGNRYQKEKLSQK